MKLTIKAKGIKKATTITKRLKKGSRSMKTRKLKLQASLRVHTGGNRRCQEQVEGRAALAHVPMRRRRGVITAVLAV